MKSPRTALHTFDYPVPHLQDDDAQTDESEYGQCRFVLKEYGACERNDRKP